MTCNMGVNGGFGLQRFQLRPTLAPRCYDLGGLEHPPHYTPLLELHPEAYTIFVSVRTHDVCTSTRSPAIYIMFRFLSSVRHLV